MVVFTDHFWQQMVQRNLESSLKRVWKSVDGFGKKRCVRGDWINQVSISIHLRLQSIMPTNHMAPPEDANWEKSCECKHLSAQNKTVSALNLCLHCKCCLCVILRSEGASAKQLFGPLQTDQSSFPLIVAQLILYYQLARDPFSIPVLFVRIYYYWTKILGVQLHLCVILVSCRWSQTLLFSFTSQWGTREQLRDVWSRWANCARSTTSKLLPSLPSSLPKLPGNSPFFGDH